MKIEKPFWEIGRKFYFGLVVFCPAEVHQTPGLFFSLILKIFSERPKSQSHSPFHPWNGWIEGYVRTIPKLLELCVFLVTPANGAKIVSRNLRIIAHLWHTCESHLLRVCCTSVYFTFSSVVWLHWMSRCRLRSVNCKSLPPSAGLWWKWFWWWPSWSIFLTNLLSSFWQKETGLSVHSISNEAGTRISGLRGRRWWRWMKWMIVRMKLRWCRFHTRKNVCEGGQLYKIGFQGKERQGWKS